MNEDRVFPASELRKFCRETENSAHLGTKATLERLRDTLAKVIPSVCAITRYRTYVYICACVCAGCHKKKLQSLSALH